MRTTKSDIVRFEVLELGATVRVNIYTLRTDAPLGFIAWEPKWYQYALTPAPEARYGVKVLRAISRQVDICMRAWERSKAKSGTSTRAIRSSARRAGYQEPASNG